MASRSKWVILILSFLAVTTAGPVSAKSTEAAQASCSISDLEGIWHIFKGVAGHISTDSDLSIVAVSEGSIALYKADPGSTDSWKEATFSAGCANGVASATGYVTVDGCTHMYMISRDDSVVWGNSDGYSKGIRVTSLFSHSDSDATCLDHSQVHSASRHHLQHNGDVHGGGD